MVIGPASIASAANPDGSGNNKFPNPTSFPDIQSFIAGFLKAVVILALPIIALFIVIAGFKFLSARGNSNKLGEARDNFKYVIYGAILILGAWALAVLIWGTVNPLINGGSSSQFINPPNTF